MFTRQPAELREFFTSPLVIWQVVGAGIMSATVAFAFLSHHPQSAAILGILPVTWVVIVGTLSGLMFLIIPRAIRHLPVNPNLLVGMIGVGLASRLILFASEPLWEIDYLRYLWDGGMLANGLNAYQWSPNDILSGQVPDDVVLLAIKAVSLVERINYPDLRTIYPPLAEAIFAGAHFLGEWSLTSWRIVLLVFDMTTLGLLVVLLRQLNQSPLWAVVYWWNPVVIQMFFNAVHMDALLIPAVLAAVLFAIRLRPLVMSGFVALAVGIKLWPVLLLPTLLRYGNPGRRLIIRAICMFILVSVIVLLPMITSGLGEGSGLTAYAVSWTRNSAVFGALEGLLTHVFTQLSLYQLDPSLIIRTIVACILIAVSLLLARRESQHADQLCHRVLMVTVALFLLSPAAFPWYATWVFAFLVLSPNVAMLVWTATLPLYHLRFHPYFLENPAYFEYGIVWLEHGPVIALLLWQWGKSRREPVP